MTVYNGGRLPVDVVTAYKLLGMVKADVAEYNVSEDSIVILNKLGQKFVMPRMKLVPSKGKTRKKS